MTSMRWTLIAGDVLEVLSRGGLGEFHGVITDPPYGINFMGRRWDRGVPSAEVWAAVRAVLVPGANVAAFGGTRTVHRLTCAIEDAGFEIRDQIISWTYGTGWPKPGNVSKFLDKRLGRERQVVGKNPNARVARAGDRNQSTGVQTAGASITMPATPEAARFEGYHSNLKPAHEPAVLARVPLRDGLAGNALEHGVAGLNVDGCRISTRDSLARMNKRDNGMFGIGQGPNLAEARRMNGLAPQGRWPANVVLTCEEAICGPGDPMEIEHRPGCHVYELDLQSEVRQSRGNVRRNTSNAHNQSATFADSSSDWTTSGYWDIGGASRFFYCAKVSKRERAGIPHPCMKPIALCRWLATLLLPPPFPDDRPRRLLVPFSGSGSEVIGALEAGWDEVVGIEFDANCDNPGGYPEYWIGRAGERIARYFYG